MAYHPAVPLPPSPMPMVGHETAAAVNLLSMSIREADLAASRAAAAGAYAHRSSPPALTAEQHQQVRTPRPCVPTKACAVCWARCTGRWSTQACSSIQRVGTVIWVLVDGSMWRLQMARSPCNLSSPGFAAMLSAAVNSMREDGQHSAEQAREALQDTLRGLPANKQIDLRVLKEAYDSSIREACAADAAVAAVAKVSPVS